MTRRATARQGRPGPSCDDRFRVGADGHRSLRQVVEAELDRLIGLLDEIDGDPDLEANGDEAEPWLGWTRSGSYGDTEDREEECEDEGAACDDEGWPEEDGDASCEDEPIFPICKTPNRTSIDPALLPLRYFMTGEGVCLDPVARARDRQSRDREVRCLQPARRGGEARAQRLNGGDRG